MPAKALAQKVGNSCNWSRFLPAQRGTIVPRSLPAFSSARNGSFSLARLNTVSISSSSKVGWSRAILR
jgi:hypothetical protein